MHIDRLFRFPVKGFPAEEITSADVVAGRGVRGDRVAAFTNGSLNVPDGSWQRYSAFTVLKNETGLQKWTVGLDLADDGAVPDDGGGDENEPTTAAVLTLTAPTGASTTFRTDDREERTASAAFLSRFIPAQGPHPRALAVADQGMFDSRLSGVSLINPATVAALGGTDEGRAALGLADEVELDPLRFRGNVLVDGLEPFAEFGLIGKVVRLGGVRLAITQAIERCPATTVNPTTTEVDVNVPRLLASTCGHLHCGVYGRILTSGRMEAGDEIVVEGPAESEMIRVDRTPRFMTVESSRKICHDIVEVSLRDELGWIGQFDEPGTNLRVHLELSDPFWRTYTITDVVDDVVSIAVRTQGKGSHAVAGLEPGARVLASGPHGTMTADRVFGGTTALITAGIGITPSLGLLRGHGTAGAHAPDADQVRLIHVDRAGRTACLWERLQARAEASGVPVRAHHHDTARLGRPDHSQLVDWLAGCDNVMVCGPVDFTKAVLAAGEEAGVGRIHQEIFASPHTGVSEAISFREPAEVTLEESGMSFLWEPDQGTLLEALEARGLQAASSCRGGSCGTCAVPLGSGSVVYPIEPAARIGAGEVLMCSAVPAGPISLRI